MSTPISGLLPGFAAAPPKTPEPVATGSRTTYTDLRPPSPPRPRLRLKRRTVSSHLSAPTQNFLASVAAADVPIPSIEEPDTTSGFPGLVPLRQLPREPFQAHLSATDGDANLLSVRGRGQFSPPKTPLPGAAPSLPQSQYPNWTIDSMLSSSAESSPDRDCGSSSRPSTGRSTQTSSSSLFSRFTQLSDDEQCDSPEDDAPGKFTFPQSGPFDRDSSSSLFFHDMDMMHMTSAAGHEAQSRRKAPWTKAMSLHLWATYILYLQDPKVTPFRVGKSCVPPHGVCLRVAREAKRSWKGAKAMARASPSVAETTTADAAAATSTATAASLAGAQATADEGGNKSGSSTPTATSSRAQAKVFMEWPHTNAATRAHLRELCRLNASTPGGGARDLRLMSRSPTPFSQMTASHSRTVRPTHMHSRSLSSSVFATRDMALSLSLATAETMQPHGPLAQLTRSRSNTTTAINTAPSTAQDLAGRLTSAIAAEEPSIAERRRLGSPFTARSYGPSSSSSLAAILGLSASSTRQSHTMGSRRSLQSPVHLNRTMTQKRRSKHLGHPDARKRPSLGSDLFTEPADLASETNDAPFLPRIETTNFSLPSSVSAPELAAPTWNTSAHALSDDRLQQQQPPPPPSPPSQPQGQHHQLAGSERQAPARLGSPFAAAVNSTSFSFPNRFSHAAEFDGATLGRPFATVQRIAQPRPVRARTNLATRLAYIDQRLRELNNRGDKARRRSESPL